MPTQPQDHKPAKGEPFKFTDLNGKSRELPPVSAGRSKTTGRDMRDAAMGGEIAQMALMFKVLEAADPDPKALDALYDMPQSDVMSILQDWGQHGDGDGASLGE